MSTLPLTVPELACLDDLGLFADEVASDLQTLEQDVYHILIERPGSNPDDIERGIGIDDMLSGSTGKLDGITHRIEAQLQKDPRVNNAAATLVQIQPGGALPDGTTLPDGGYLLEIEIVADQGVLGLSFVSSGNEGLVPL